MNGNALIRILATFGLLIASLWVAFDIFTSGSNAVARFYMYSMVVSGVYGLLNARRAFFVTIFLTGYLDFFKRFMIFDSGLSKMDLYYVLGIAPATLAGITGNILYQHFTGKLPGRPGLTKLIVVTLALTGAALFLSLTSNKGGYRSIGDTVNATIYILLLFIVPVLFRTPEELRRLLKVVVILYVPAIFYMLVHYFRGSIFDWEMDYLKSGLTIEIRQLRERVFRPFGTMNSAANASMVFACVWTMCLSSIWRKPDRVGRSMMFGLRLLLVPLIALAMYATYSRTGWVFAVVAVLAAPMIKNRALTLVGYGMAMAAFLTLFFASPYLLKHRILNVISEDIWEEKQTNEWAQTTNLATLNDRLEAFASLLKEPRAWTPLGLRFSPATESTVRNNVASHEMLTVFLLNYGYLTLIFAGGFLFWQLWRLHTMVFNEPEPLAKGIGATCLAIGLALTSGATTNGAQFSTYPVNFFIWFSFAAGVSLYLYAHERAALEAPAVAAGSPPAGARNPLRLPAPPPPRAGGLPVPAHAKG